MANFIQICPLTEDDYKAASKIQAELMRDIGVWNSDAIQRICLRGVGLAAKSARGDLVGFMLAQVIENTAEILTFGVISEYQGQGIGASLLEHFLKDAHRRGVTDILLDVRADNQIAISLYQKHGFIIISNRPNYYKTLANNYIDAIVMSCHL